MPDGGFHNVVRNLGELRRAIAQLEQGGGARARPVLTSGLGRLDGFLPGGGLMFGALHALEGFSAAGFAAFLAARALAQKSGPLLWCEAPGSGLSAYLPGLKHFGLSPERLLFLKGAKASELLWTLEEALKSGALAGLVARLPKGLDLTQGRRLQLAAQAGGTPAFLLLPGPAALPVATTRWRVTPLSILNREVFAAWNLELLKARGGRPGQWRVTYDDTTLRLDLLSPPERRAVSAA